MQRTGLHSRTRSRLTITTKSQISAKVRADTLCAVQRVPCSIRFGRATACRLPLRGTGQRDRIGTVEACASPADRCRSQSRSFRAVAEVIQAFGREARVPSLRALFLGASLPAGASVLRVGAWAVVDMAYRPCTGCLNLVRPQRPAECFPRRSARCQWCCGCALQQSAAQP